MESNTGLDDKSSKLLALLDAQLGEEINRARLKLIFLFILALCKVQTVSFHKFAGVFDSDSKAESSLRRVQWFIAGFALYSDVIAGLIFLYFLKNGFKIDSRPYKLEVWQAKYQYFYACCCLSGVLLLYFYFHFADSIK